MARAKGETRVKRLLPLLLMVPALSFAGEIDAVVLGKSWHFGSETSYSYNGVNPGIGLEYRLDNGFFVGALTYRDSYRQQAYAAYAGYQYTQHVSGPWSVFAAVRAGYLHGSGFNGPMLMPTVGVQYERLSIELEYIPKIGRGRVNEIGIFGRWRF